MTSTTNDYNLSYYYNYVNYSYEEQMATFAEYKQIITERTVFRYMYHALAACIVILNGLAVFTIVVSRKQRRHFRNWLILHILFVHILFGGIAVPFNAQTLDQTAAGLGSVPLCKLFMFISDITEYMSTLSIGIFGVFHCLNMISARLLKSVSNVLLLSIMIILPWFVVVMLTAVLRLTMSEEQYGQCYIVSDQTAQNLWFVLSFAVPMTLVLADLLTIIILKSLCCILHSNRRFLPSKQSFTMFAVICLAACLVLRTPIHVIMFEPIRSMCTEKYRPLTWYRMLHGPDIVKLFSMVLIPLVFVIQMDIRRRCKKFRSRILCKTVDVSSNARKQQTVEMITMTNNIETSVV